jgi:hypothetical protein
MTISDVAGVDLIARAGLNGDIEAQLSEFEYRLWRRGDAALAGVDLFRNSDLGHSVWILMLVKF